MPDPDAHFAFVDLFAGIGGFAAALSAMGGECAYAVEIDSAAARTYKEAWGHDPLGDITVDANENTMNVPEHQILAAGFPCQPFSKSGAQRGMEETRGTLYWNILKIIQARHPLVVLLENVRNLAGPRHEHEWDVIIRTLRAEGYRVSDTPAVFSPHQIPRKLGGRPQVRERVFITATYDPTGILASEPPEPAVTPRTRVPGFDPRRDWDLARDLPLDASRHVPGSELSRDERRWINAWDAWVQMYYEISGGEQPPGHPIWVDDWRTLGELEQVLLEQPDLPRWKQGFLRKNAELYERFREPFDLWLEDWQVRNDAAFPPSRRKFEWQAQDTARLWDCVMHLRPSGIRAKRPTYLPALVAITQTSIIGPRERRLSVREAARLQGLPDGFPLDHQPNDAVTYRQLGNGVNVGAVWFVLREHVRRDQQVLQETEAGRRILKAVADAPQSPDEILARHFETKGDGVGNKIVGDELLVTLAHANEAAKHEAAYLEQDPDLEAWREVIDRLSEDDIPKTYLAILAVTLVARALLEADKLDVRHIKASTSPNGYSASSIGKSLASFAKEQRIDLRATSSQPLNNQPFTFEPAIKPEMGVAPRHQQAWAGFYQDVCGVNGLTSEEARRVLALLFHLRRSVDAPTIKAKVHSGGKATLDKISAAVGQFVSATADGGKVGQSFVAALLDLMYGSDEVALGKTQDPDAGKPGDVHVGWGSEGVWLWTEAKQKTVATGDVKGFLEKVHGVGGERVVYFALTNSAYSGSLKEEQIEKRAAQLGMGVTVIESPPAALDWLLPLAPGSFASVSGRLLERMHARMTESGCSPQTLKAFGDLASQYAKVS